MLTLSAPFLPANQAEPRTKQSNSPPKVGAEKASTGYFPEKLAWPKFDTVDPSAL
jgi:hypothetical protein